jgi:hypothetical protein
MYTVTILSILFFRYIYSEWQWWHSLVTTLRKEWSSGLDQLRWPEQLEQLEQLGWPEQRELTAGRDCSRCYSDPACFSSSFSPAQVGTLRLHTKIVRKLANNKSGVVSQKKIIKWICNGFKNDDWFGIFQNVRGGGGGEGTISPDYICLNMELMDRA